MTPGGRLFSMRGELRLDPVDDLPGVLAHEHHRHAHHGLATAVAGDDALADHRGELHLRHVADVQGRPLSLVRTTTRRCPRGR